ncbi:MAG: hypothetical protein JWL77_1501 [Chthonomonadaceae bacterium]|nr:hypothetical protein [Chthonomonadaceae bacterium]
MQFNPKTEALFTDGGEFIKVLHCPLRKQWDQMVPQPDSTDRICASCEKTVLNTSEMTDGEVLSVVQSDPTICLAVNLQAPNVTIAVQSRPARGWRQGVLAIIRRHRFLRNYREL